MTFDAKKLNKSTTYTKLSQHEYEEIKPIVDLFNGEIVGVYLKGVIE